MAKKKTETTKPGTHISHCNFVGIEKASVEEICATVRAIAVAAEENARALNVAARALSGNMIHIDAMVKIEG